VEKGTERPWLLEIIVILDWCLALMSQLTSLFCQSARQFPGYDYPEDEAASCTLMALHGAMPHYLHNHNYGNLKSCKLQVKYKSVQIFTWPNIS
jgi:hypothetical protein